MSYSITDLSADCYPETTVLVNKLGIRSQEALDDLERVVTGIHTVEIVTEQSEEPLSFAFYRNLHKRLFGDLYEWAGELRKVDMSKQGTSFCRAENLEEIGNAIFQWLRKHKELRGMKRERFVKELADLYHRINMLHPFREGNGRTQRLFFTLLIRRAGYEIDFASTDTDALMIATVYAAQGVMDYLYGYFDRAIVSSSERDAFGSDDA